LRRTAYDFAAAAEAVRRTSYPEREDAAAGIVRPATAEEAITVFERMAGRVYPRSAPGYGSPSSPLPLSSSTF
jgi:hypothetical protein